MQNVQLTARVPEGVAAWLKARADKNRRSANAELVVLLEAVAAQDVALPRDAAPVEGVAA
jgi:plasmid stability protein